MFFKLTKASATYEDLIHHHSYTHNFSSCEIKAWKKFSPEQDLNPWPHGLSRVQVWIFFQALISQLLKLCA